MFETVSGTDSFAFRQNTIHGGQPIAQFYSPTKVCTCHGDCQIPNMYNKTSVDILIANTYNDTYIKTEIDSLIPNINLSNYYTKSEVDDIDNELSTLILDTYTKTEIDTQLAGYAAISHLQGNYMTTLSITETLMNNYASITLLVDSLCDKTYSYNQVSLKADVSQLTEFVTTDYLTAKHTNSLELPTYYYKKLILIICCYLIVLVLMLIITFTLKLKLILY